MAQNDKDRDLIIKANKISKLITSKKIPIYNDGLLKNIEDLIGWRFVRFFGFDRYERVLHEILNSVLSSSAFKGVACDIFEWLAKELGLKLPQGRKNRADRVYCDAEVCRENSRFDILLQYRGKQINLELKMNAKLGHEQHNNYTGLVKKDKKNHCYAVISRNPVSLAADNNIFWPSLCNKLVSSIKRHKPWAKKDREILVQLIEGAARL